MQIGKMTIVLICNNKCKSEFYFATINIGYDKTSMALSTCCHENRPSLKSATINIDMHHYTIDTCNSIQLMHSFEVNIRIWLLENRDVH